jgi:C_GCAxxG_C_C family probable redox protein
MNKEEIDDAVKRFGCGCNCCQTILLTHNKKYGLTDELPIKLGTGFGGGYARQGETCGAVTGSLMVIGLKYGMTKIKDEIPGEKTYENVIKFLHKFKEKNKSLQCRELLGCDISTSEGRELAKKNGRLDRCPDFVKSAAEILDEIL